MRLVGTLGVEHLQQVPANAFSFPVFVSGQNQLVGIFEGILQRLNHLFSCRWGSHIAAQKSAWVLTPSCAHFSPLTLGGISLADRGKSRTCPIDALYLIPGWQVVANGFSLGG